jgi:hypothetical protein
MKTGKDMAYLGEKIEGIYATCPSCKNLHRIIWGKTKIDGVLVEQKSLGAVKCFDDSLYLVSVNGLEVIN